MANTNIQFCFSIQMTQKAVNYALSLDQAITLLDMGRDLGECFCDRVETAAKRILTEYEDSSGSHFEDVGGGRLLVRHTGRYANMDVVADVIQSALSTFSIPGIAVIEYSFISSAVTLCRVGRGYVIVSANEQSWWDHEEWLAGRQGTLNCGNEVISVQPAGGVPGEMVALAS